MTLKRDIPRVQTLTGDRTTMPDWVREGEIVAVVCSGRHGTDSVTFQKVERVTPKFVTVDNTKFSLVKGLERAGERDAYGPKYFLADPNAPATKFARAEYRLENLAYTAGVKANAFARKVTRENAREAAAAFQAYVEADAKLEMDQEAWLDRQWAKEHEGKSA
jgi:hypothetical protein